MGGHYEKDLFRQLQEVMERCDKIENKLEETKVEERAKTRTQIGILKTENKAAVKVLNERISSLEKENEGLKEENQLLKDDNERMKRIINNDSSNTSLPPSTDQKGKSANTYNSREKTGKKCGGQKGHKGRTLTRETIEDKIEKGILQHKVVNQGEPVGRYTSRYVVDLEIIPTVTELRFYADGNGKITIPEEYRSEVIYGPVIKAMAVDLYSDGVVANDRIGSFINAISGNALELSEGSIYNFCNSFAQKCTGSIRQIEDGILNSSVAGTDATVVTTNGVQTYIRNFSTDHYVLYKSMQNKDIKSMKEIGIMANYTGVFVNDHETATYHFGNDNAECNVHLIRYLTKNTQECGGTWSEELTRFLLSMNAERNLLILNGETSIPEGEVARYEAEYDEIVANGRKENKKTQGKYARKDENALLNRLEKYKRNHLLFLHDFRIPFSNNMSEQDLRKSKNRQKMAGGFRKPSGSEMYCSIMSVIETCKRKGMPLFDNIISIFRGTPAIF